MTKPKNKPTAQEILNVIDGMWVDVNGISVIAYCGYNTALEHMKKIREQIRNKYDKECPRSFVPTDVVIDYFNINVNYLRKVKERKI